MNTYIPLEYYLPVYYNLMLVCTLSFFLSKTSFTSRQNLQNKNIFGIVFLIFSILYIGFRPISGKFFTDMRTYAQTFLFYQSGEPVRDTKDIYFEYFMKACSAIMDVNYFFVVCAVLFLLPFYITSKKLFEKYWFYAFWMLVASFSFWGAATNGIRNGIATSFVLLAVAFHQQRTVMAILFLIAAAFHKSTLLPIFAFLLTYLHNDSRKYLFFWVLCIPVSLVVGGVFESAVNSIGFFDDDRLGYLTDDEYYSDGLQSNRFRWDFILYSAFATFAGWYFVIKKNYEDELYRRLLNMYLLSNGIWILIIRANFSNRFAYLSWFVMGLVVIYPFLKMMFFKKQDGIMKLVILFYFLFTYIMYLFVL